MDANRKGDMELCRVGRTDLAKMAAYCNKKFTTDYTKNQECTEPETFCYSCCESEFGGMFMAERDVCTSMCDDEEKKEMGHGDWIWNPEKKEE